MRLAKLKDSVESRAQGTLADCVAQRKVDTSSLQHLSVSNSFLVDPKALLGRERAIHAEPQTAADFEKLMLIPASVRPRDMGTVSQQVALQRAFGCLKPYGEPPCQKDASSDVQKKAAISVRRFSVWAGQNARANQLGKWGAASYDAEDSSAIYASQGSEDPFRRVARKSQFEDMIQMLRENPGRDNTEAGEAELHGDGSPDPDANALRRTNPYEWDFTNKRKVKLTTKQLRKMFSPRQPPGIEVSSPRRTYRRWSEESDPNSEFEELSSFGGDQEDTSWIDEFLSAPARRDSWHAPASLKENQLLRVTNDDLQEACLRGDLGLVKRLINARASVNAPIRPQDADEFMTLLHVLARKPHMQNCSSIIAEMVRNKANLNVRSSLGTTPLSLACHAKHTEAVEVLLRAKASADPIDDYGKKAPLYAILPPWDETLVDNADENLTVKTVQLLARARTNLDDGGDNSPIVESVWTELKGLAPQKKAFYDASQLELLEDLDLQDVDKKHKVVFQQLVSQILTINRSFTTGIRRSDLKEWHEMSKFRPATSEDHQHFVGQVLSNAQLLGNGAWPMRVAGWHDFVKPLRERKDELELGLQRLRTQLRMTRETYLKARVAQPDEGA
ncbi:hypothetical protein AK812_SmicGene14774 [Symbiodinium microadriaticum]|uniref:Uncharacterized protein n=1 Tax=Symbiodinium microadriaticum TaxID=2951 RepID=A0A1Q9E4N2_SYMMI|nr:hypothetical protein AK812_SmicGene14774 [Symbiodinium microadriaticum]